MPYIKLDQRVEFKEHILAALAVINGPNENQFVQGEYFGFFVNRLLRRFLGDPTYDSTPVFNSTFFNQAKKKSLQNAVDSIEGKINKLDPLGAAGEINYCITALYWGFLGESSQCNTASYGMRAYFTGILDKVHCELSTPDYGTHRDKTMAFRRYLILRGVLQDVISETYRRQTAYYEDEKKLDNRDIWLNGELVMPKDVPLSANCRNT